MAVHSLPAAQTADLLRQSGLTEDEVDRCLLEGDGVAPLPPTIALTGSKESSYLDVSIKNLSDEILKLMAAKHLYEVHLDPRPTPHGLLVRYRSGKKLKSWMELSLSESGALLDRFKLLAEMDVKERECPKLGYFRRKVLGTTLLLFVTSVPTVNGEKLLIRRARSLAEKPPMLLAHLGMEPFVLEKYTASCRQRGGAIIFTGPYNCGKTTTIFATLRELYSTELNITTGEFEFEYLMEGVNQSLATWSGPAGTTFGDRFRACRSQDVDIIVAKLEELDNACAALRTATTGVSVMGSMHHKNPVRVLDYFSLNLHAREMWLAIDGIKAIVARRFIKVLCPHCKESYKPSAPLLKQLGINERLLQRLRLEQNLQHIEFYRAKGCSACHKKHNRLTGYQELSTGIHSVLFMNDDVRQTLRQRGTFAELSRVCYKSGMLTLRESALRKAILGETSLEQAVLF